MEHAVSLREGHVATHSKGQVSLPRLPLHLLRNAQKGIKQTGHLPTSPPSSPDCAKYEDHDWGRVTKRGLGPILRGLGSTLRGDGGFTKRGCGHLEDEGVIVSVGAPGLTVQNIRVTIRTEVGVGRPHKADACARYTLSAVCDPLQHNVGGRKMSRWVCDEKATFGYRPRVRRIFCTKWCKKPLFPEHGMNCGKGFKTLSCHAMSYHGMAWPGEACRGMPCVLSCLVRSCPVVLDPSVKDQKLSFGSVAPGTIAFRWGRQILLQQSLRTEWVLKTEKGGGVISIGQWEIS
mmetsp:Transcript_83910/g.140039  ORF Transcript_83910/g.140039 Transcript_83910/m.140039 type:complete len:290 (+) Transcript_83910:955-1824(+)